MMVSTLKAAPAATAAVSSAKDLNSSSPSPDVAGAGGGSTGMPEKPARSRNIHVGSAQHCMGGGATLSPTTAGTSLMIPAPWACYITRATLHTPYPFHISLSNTFTHCMTRVPEREKQPPRAPAAVKPNISSHFSQQFPLLFRVPNLCHDQVPMYPSPAILPLPNPILFLETPYAPAKRMEQDRSIRNMHLRRRSPPWRSSRACVPPLWPADSWLPPAGWAGPGPEVEHRGGRPTPRAAHGCTRRRTWRWQSSCWQGVCGEGGVGGHSAQCRVRFKFFLPPKHFTLHKLRPQIHEQTPPRNNTNHQSCSHSAHDPLSSWTYSPCTVPALMCMRAWGREALEDDWLGPTPHQDLLVPALQHQHHLAPSQLQQSVG